MTGIFQSDNELNVAKDFRERGFVFAPFDSDEHTVLIQPDEVYVSEIESRVTRPDSEIKLLDEGREVHLKLVEAGIKAIKKGDLKKVVLSRNIEADCSSNPEEIFTRLLNSYQNAFCYLFHHPKVGIWCGATPETLVQIKEKELRTMSLAATLPVDEFNPPKWGSKEIEEQQMVSDYIQKRLVDKLDALHIGQAESVKAGNLWHLKSEITGAISSKTNLKEIVQALHPTPAVCGIPVDAAKKFISNHENYKRSFYTGFLGELNLWNKNEIALYVNLRCMELLEKKAVIFVGGGITSASDPEREWIETQNKSKTMLNIL
ncbi:isochorismate synthase [Flagellimonas sp.]|uniref:isochorismate synthase n=1 Tax=Flagellimonas sp. TaxID=2058762 RepID=UPI003B503856